MQALSIAAMTSIALTQWRSSGLARLGELEAVRANLTGTGRGRRWDPTLVGQLETLDREVAYRNVIGHGDETKIAALEAGGEIKATKRSYELHRRALDALAGTVDDVVAAQLAGSLGIAKWW